ncbi:alpha/beta hydrolase [Helcobacillus massiliensis]|uniref:alpha/beta hydrolase n=1 Tax=Helcobacillus massiliensis TaxID=521392 RepID=UPI0025558F05|nr:alpha/beta hydrolase [Helcobacillus massiliensis]MDK7741939.1 alpha/beta hydrolase [Helcobacillus massiliensis]WOO93150.1 alpha/beta hydrolase [Helcobacillus massiliensis]
MAGTTPDTKDTMTVHSPRRRRSAAALIASAVLALSGCGFISSLSGDGDTDTTKPGTAPGITDAKLDEPRSLDGASPIGPGTDGMAQLTGASPVATDSDALKLTVDPRTDGAYAKYYSQKIEWKGCEKPEWRQAQCATVTVPLQWSDPSKGNIELQLTRRAAADGERKGSILINPGGPGGSGADMVGSYGDYVVTDTLRSSFDIVGFDPRGVADSHGIRCIGDDKMDAWMDGTYFSSDPDDVEGQAKEMKEAFDQCAQNSGDILPYMDTFSSARDMDVIRAALGEDKLDYLGFSYGTFLGATYAELFPDTTGHFVLDGAVDPQLTGDEIAAGQARGFQASLEKFAKFCMDSGSECPLTGTPEEGAQQMMDWASSLEDKPLKGPDGRSLTPNLARTTIISMMYNTQNWQPLQNGLNQAMKNGDATTMMMLADFATERNQDGTYKGNSTWSINAVNCLDRQYVTDQKWMDEESERLKKAYPAVGDQMAYTGAICGSWPQKPVRQAATIDAEGAGPIVVIGTKNDPATPYEWSVSLNEQLADSTLITYDGWGHTAYGSSGGCVEDAVDEFFLNGTKPQDGLTCS